MRKFWSSVHALRGIAAGLVVAHHIPTYLRTHGFPGIGSFELGAFGVDIFFAISGFVMYFTCTSSALTASKFIWDRIIRIVPLYWMMTILLAGTAMLMPSIFSQFRVDWQALCKSLLFFSQYNEKGFIRPVLSMGWTLHYEVLFYLVTGALILLNGKRVNNALSASAVITILAVGIYLSGTQTNFSSLQLLAPIAIEFLFGAIAAWLIHIHSMWLTPGIRYGSSALLLGIAVALLINSQAYDMGVDMTRFVYWGIPGAATLWIALSFEPQLSRILGPNNFSRLLGDASYSIYLTHGFSFSISNKLLSKLPIESAPLAAVALLLIAIALGISVHLMLEKPLQSYLKRIYRAQ